jgi:cyclohexyl-isocyanide hydratase
MGAAHVFGKIPNAELLFVGKEKGLASSILGMGPTVVASTTMAECPPLDVLIIGASHPKYISDKEVQDFITEQEKSAKAMIGVCAGTFLLGSTGLLNDKEAATNYHQTRD